MNIAILGKGNVGGTLGKRWTENGHDVVYGSRTPDGSDTKSFKEAVDIAEIVVLTVPANAVAPELFAGIDLSGKILIDCTNPINADFSEIDWGGEHSQGEKVARLAPAAKVVKAFNTVGFNIMDDPDFTVEKASMLVAGDDAEAKQTVLALAEEIGFDPVDAGPLVQSRYLEAFAWLWISMALKYGQGREMAFHLMKR